MYCDKCGNKVSDNAKFCSNCGSAISDQPMSYQQGSNDDNSMKHNVSATYSKPKKNLGIIILCIIIFIILSVACVFIAVHFISGSDSNHKKSYSSNKEDDEVNNDEFPSEKIILKDLNEYVFMGTDSESSDIYHYINVEEYSFSSLTINKMDETDNGAKYWVNTVISGEYNITFETTLTYINYEVGGWQLDYVEEENIDEMIFSPVAGVLNYQIMDVLYDNKAVVGDTTVISQNTNLEDGTDIITLRCEGYSAIGTIETLEEIKFIFDETCGWVFDTINTSVESADISFETDKSVLYGPDNGYSVHFTKCDDDKVSFTIYSTWESARGKLCFDLCQLTDVKWEFYDDELIVGPFKVQDLFNGGYYDLTNTQYIYIDMTTSGNNLSLQDEYTIEYNPNGIDDIYDKYSPYSADSITYITDETTSLDFVEAYESYDDWGYYTYGIDQFKSYVLEDWCRLADNPVNIAVSSNQICYLNETTQNEFLDGEIVSYDRIALYTYDEKGVLTNIEWACCFESHFDAEDAYELWEANTYNGFENAKLTHIGTIVLIDISEHLTYDTSVTYQKHYEEVLTLSDKIFDIT